MHAAGQLRLWDGERHRIDGNLTLELAAGHTPGSAVVSLESMGESAVFAGDLLHSPLQVSHPEMDSCFCEDPAAARAGRERLLQQAADRRALLLPAHFGTSGAARVGRDGDRFTITGWAAFSSGTAA
ncbi:MBL fold metallo-hydrolase [Peterkaempfera bronchialis]|uniref:MBL fold metallo-hydrolase n=1 Tax=Peterkaempfera bronchialis TaxID=2126346 RepID=UPI003C2C346F